MCISYLEDGIKMVQRLAKAKVTIVSSQPTQIGKWLRTTTRFGYIYMSLQSICNIEKSISVYQKMFDKHLREFKAVSNKITYQFILNAPIEQIKKTFQIVKKLLWLMNDEVYNITSLKCCNKLQDNNDTV